MFRSLSNSWTLMKASMAVLRADKELIIFPFISMIGVIIVCIGFAIPLFASGVIDNISKNVSNSDSVGVFGFIAGLVFYTVMYTVIIFFNSALVGAAVIRLRGGDPTLQDGLKMAMDNIGNIVIYAFISATVGMILRSIQSSARGKGIGGIIASIIAGIIGFAWSIATFLVVPVLVIEKISPIDAIKRSSALLKQTWGEQLTGNFAISTVVGLIGLAVAIVVGGLFALIASATNSGVVMVAGIGVVILVIAAVSLFGSALQGIYVAAVYCYVTDGAEASKNAYFDQQMVANAFSTKTK